MRGHEAHGRHTVRLEPQAVQQVVTMALAEDVGWGDLTTEALLPEPVPTQAVVLAKDTGVVAGLPVVAAVFQAVDAALTVTRHAADGDPIAPGQA